MGRCPTNAKSGTNESASCPNGIENKNNENSFKKNILIFEYAGNGHSNVALKFDMF